ncbi:formimidoylglutamase [Flavobacterium psychrophilum]|uniref:Formimidoylglutamase n=1 Tax=Flavobacterium psychrophilum TaxID=96345 RepID=A0A1Z5HLJ2_FLAPS|nr:formimidoylglutamase [Flavobacterium psychrophilum]EKT3957080.1 formimidoylglutamase [Flavobacterium psychrophilum]EKT4497835.1 formimidoylglutamase [Flavobacterium psychrophilum]EKT4500821.1 formimidoylglutamase [Flavobacterium psychrophilum]EKT4508518.1 formimidoylglutamase [Flavobacterium psychrophilum]EKT4518827.1 formimidoylglutamase [Flavobacterium psychrophilum]
MENLIRFKQSDLAKITNFRNGEVKFGEKMITVPKDENITEFITNSEAKYVILGIPEDVGIRANLGRSGADSAWNSAIQSIANIQHNRFCKGNLVIILGQVDVSQEIDLAKNLDQTKPEDRKQLFKIVEQIDKEVSHIIFSIVKAGKIPIIIGGGHNNAYGNIKGTALAKGKSINVINFDAHSDFRILEGRHSGNGFSYAFDEGFLKRYFIFGLHESYTSKSVLDSIKKIEDRVKYNTYDEIKIRHQKYFEQEMIQSLDFIKKDFFGIEIDLDAIPNIASSAMTLSGFSVEELRQFIYYFSQNQNASYIHICEGAPSLGEEKNNHLIGKLIGYLITDFIKGNSQG